MKILESKLRSLIKIILLESPQSWSVERDELKPIRKFDTQGSSQISTIAKLWKSASKSSDIFKDIQKMCKENARESSCRFEEIGRVEEKSSMFIKSIKPHNKNNEIKKKLKSADFNIESAESSMRATDGFSYFISLVIDEICEEGQIFRVEGSSRDRFKGLYIYVPDGVDRGKVVHLTAFNFATKFIDDAMNT
jgi:hypothetical protein